MSEHHIQISWKRESADFEYDTYSRTHEVHVGGGQKILNSATPEFKGSADYTNPEELLAASLATCHMLTFLAICARGKISVSRYEDRATAILDKTDDGKLAVTKIILHPQITFEGTPPDSNKLKDLHEKAHRNCFIGNSIKCTVEIK